jgi:hypothetical protein
MTRILLALASAATLAACALPEPNANTAALPYVEKDVVTGSHLPAKNNSQGTKRIDPNASIDRNEMLRPGATPLSQ